MAKKNNAVAEAPTASAKRTPEEKAQRKADKASRRASKDLADGSAPTKASQKQTLKTAAKQVQKELDARMNEVVTRIRKETKAKLKEVLKEATRRLDVDTDHLFEQAMHTLVRHYDSIAPGRSNDLSFPAPTTANTPETSDNQQAVSKTTKTAKAPAPQPSSTKGQPAAKKTPAPAPAKASPRAARPASGSKATNRGPGRPKRGVDTVVTESLSTPTATTNDGVAVDNV